MTHPAESLHWYKRDGSTAYTVKSKDGTDRPATLRDARKLNLVPSVTAIIKCAAAPGLEVWKQQQVMLAALTLPKLATESEKDYLARIFDDSKQQAKRAAEKGSLIHAAIQGHYERETVTPEYWPYIRGVLPEVDSIGGIEITYEAERSFAHPMGFGGKVDLCKLDVIIDFKTKEFSASDYLKTWDEHAMQLAAYRHGLGLMKARCAIVYVSTLYPGVARLMEIPEEDLAKGWQMFRGLLSYWQAKTGYCSAWQMEEVAAA